VFNVKVLEAVLTVILAKDADIALKSANVNKKMLQKTKKSKKI
jgi:hypothetical protein